MTSASISSTSRPIKRQRVLVFGTFDGLHPGHKFVLSEASKRGELFVVVARDVTVSSLKSRSPEHTELVRRDAIADAFPHAHVLLGSAEGDFLAPVREVAPDLILLGYDQKLPPGVDESHFSCPVERLAAFKPDKYKSSLLRRGA